NRKPSPPLFGMPPVVGMSAAVMPTRITCSADAPPNETLLRKAAIASHPKHLVRNLSRLFVIPAKAGIQEPTAAAVVLDPHLRGGDGSHISHVIGSASSASVASRKNRANKSSKAFLDPQTAGDMPDAAEHFGRVGLSAAIKGMGAARSEIA